MEEEGETNLRRMRDAWRGEERLMGIWGEREAEDTPCRLCSPAASESRGRGLALSLLYLSPFLVLIEGYMSALD